MKPKPQLIIALLAIALAGCAPAAAASSIRAPEGYVRAEYKGLQIDVPGQWLPYTTPRRDRYDTRETLIVSLPPGSRNLKTAQVGVVASRYQRMTADPRMLRLDPWCEGCPTAEDVHVTDARIDGRRGTLYEAVRADGSHLWMLVVANDCYAYAVAATASADRLGESADTVRTILASTHVAWHSRDAAC